MITPPAPCTGSPMNAATFSGADFEDLVLDRLRGARGEGVLVLAEAVAEAVGLHDVLDAGQPRAALRVHVRFMPPRLAPAMVEP